MIKLKIGFMAAVLLLSCDRPKIDYKSSLDTTSLVDDQVVETTKILVSELPVKFDSTDILLFAVSRVDLRERGSYGKYSSGSYSNDDIASAYFHSDNLIGDFSNIVFRDKTGKESKLTDKKIQIRNVTFQREIFNSTKNGYLLYSVSDRDSNGDKELNHSDLEALYISRIDGSGFKKLTKELHEFYDLKILRRDSRIYFRTLEDSNKDGDLNNKDQFHYYFIDFSGDQYSVSEYNPLKLFRGE